MDVYAQLEVRITDHTHIRYLERVGSIERDELRIWCAERIKDHRYMAKKKFQLILIDEVWFAYVIENKQLFLVTCYGRSHLDLPRAIAWAVRHNDRIALDRPTS